MYESCWLQNLKGTGKEFCAPLIYRFTDLVCKWPGAVYDSFIFNESGLNTYLSGVCNGWLLGDSGTSHSLFKIHRVALN